LLGDAILMIPGQSTHFVAIRWHDDQSVNEMSFRVGAFEWKGILRELQAGEKSLRVSHDREELYQEFYAAKNRALRISLGSVVNVGRWPPLRIGDYRLVLVERSDERAEVFFFEVDEKRFDRPLAVAAAHLKKNLLRVEVPTVRLRQIEGMAFIDTIQADEAL